MPELRSGSSNIYQVTVFFGTRWAEPNLPIPGPHFPKIRPPPVVRIGKFIPDAASTLTSNFVSSSLHHLYAPPCLFKIVTLFGPFLKYFNCILIPNSRLLTVLGATNVLQHISFRPNLLPSRLLQVEQFLWFSHRVQRSSSFKHPTDNLIM